MKRLFKQKKRALTLVEMLAVVAVIGLLFALNTPDVSGMFNSGKEELIKADCRTFELGLTQAMLDSEGFTLLNDTSSSSIVIYINQYLSGNIQFATTDIPFEYVSRYKTPYGKDYVLTYHTGTREFELKAHKTESEVSDVSLVLSWDSANQEVRSELHE